MAATSLENGSADKPWNDLVQSTCEGSSSPSVRGWSSRFCSERGLGIASGAGKGDSVLLGLVAVAASARRGSD